jgi:hypothetical protein
MFSDMKVIRRCAASIKHFDTRAGSYSNGYCSFAYSALLPSGWGRRGRRLSRT